MNHLDRLNFCIYIKNTQTLYAYLFNASKSALYYVIVCCNVAPYTYNLQEYMSFWLIILLDYLLYMLKFLCEKKKLFLF